MSNSLQDISKESAATNQSKMAVQEKVDGALLNKYMEYDMGIEADMILKKSGKKFKSMTPSMNKQEFDLMIENYLANERNTLRKMPY